MRAFAWLTAFWLVSVAARAEVALERLPPELELAGQLRVREDASGALGFADVARSEAGFGAVRDPALHFGFSDSALWLRFAARNGGTRPVDWLLVLDEPTLDRVELYVQHRDGRLERHRGGDDVPYVEREFGDAHTAFALRTEPGDRAVYTLRVQSADVLRAPLRAWQPAAYAAQRERETVAQWLFYGALLMLVLHNLGVFALTRQVEHLYYALASLSFCLVLISLHGQSAQLLFPERPWLCRRLAPLSMALATVFVTMFMSAVIERLAHRRSVEHYFRYAVLASCGLAAFCLLAPVGLCFRVVAAVMFAAGLSGPLLLYLLGGFPVPEIALYRRSWLGLCTALVLTVLYYAALLPDWPWVRWALPVGFVTHGVNISLALATIASSMRNALSKMNEQLRANVDGLGEALARAQQANAAAQRAAKAKDEFVATMSHELRTPLNAIINIPQGLINEFVSVRTARCGACQASFLLEDELVGPDSACEDCRARGTLIEGHKLKYRGDAARYLRFLQKIERSGQHLLQMVNGVLDYSKLEVGSFELTLAPVDLNALIREVTDQLIDIAQRKGVQIELAYDVPAGRSLVADGLRLKQVLINLLANAVKFSEPGSVVSLRWRALADAELLEVEDRGIGIDPADHERIFTSFEQVQGIDRGKYGGTGLGLSISRSLVRMHGGELSVRSALGQGATFEIRLPRMRLPRADNTNEFALESNPRTSLP